MRSKAKRSQYIKAYMKKYRRDHPEYSRAYAREYYRKHPDYDKQWKKAHPESVNRTRRKNKVKLKTQVLLKYCNGTKPRCACCWENGLQFLTLSPLLKPGAEYKRLKKNGWSLYYHLRKTNYADKFEVLCWNCYTARINTQKCHDK